LKFCPSQNNIARVSGITLIELILVVVIISILAMVAIPTYRDILKNNEMTTAKTDILNIELRVQRFFTQERRFPVDAAELGGLPDDPWGNPYVYLNIGIQNGVGQLRKDKNLVPINTDYDLYSKGPDGRSVSPLTAQSSRDDIIRANNGAYIGEAEDY